MTEARSRPVLAQISANRVDKSARTKHASYLPVSPKRKLSPPGRPRNFMMDELEEDNDTRDSFPRSDDSNVSNLSLLADETSTDDFGRKIIEHARWTKRSALEGGPVIMQAFGKARPSAGLASMMGELHELGELHVGDELNERNDRPAASLESDRSASPNIPRQWGRKGIQSNEFLRRLTAVEQPRDSRSLDRNVPVATDVPLPSAVAEQERVHIPTRVFAVKKSLEEDNQRQSELHDVESRAVTTNRLGEMGRAFQKEARASRLPRVNSIPQVSTLNDSTNEESHTELRKPRRQGSRDLLVQLARATSSTPSPKYGQDNEQSKRQRQKIAHPLVSASLDLSTPIPAGAWVDTPNAYREKATEGKGPQFPSSIPRATRKGQVRGKSQPRSVLEAILRSGDDDLSNDPLEESTIASLKDLVAQDETGDLSTVLQLDEGTLELVSNVTVPLDRGQGLRSEEKEALQRMGAALKSARMGLRDASKGIKRVEHQFEQAEKKQSHGGPGRTCDYCGSPYPSYPTLSGILSNACTHFFNRCYSWPKGGRLCMTWFGFLTLILTTWVVAEVVLYQTYAHPKYASAMVGYGIEDEVPWIGYVATAILARRPFKRHLWPAWKFVRWMFFSIFQSFFSGSANDGFKAGRPVQDRGGFGSPSEPFGHDIGFSQDEIV